MLMTWYIRGPGPFLRITHAQYTVRIGFSFKKTPFIWNNEYHLLYMSALKYLGIFIITSVSCIIYVLHLIFIFQTTGVNVLNRYRRTQVL